MPWGWNVFGMGDQGVKQDREAVAYTRPYLDHILGQYAILPPGPHDDRTNALRALLDAIKSKRDNQNPIAVNDIFLAEGALLNLLPLEALRSRAPILRGKYRADAGEEAFAAYQASGPPDAATATAEALRADLNRLLDELHWMYAMTPVRERIRSLISWKISGWLLGIAFVGTVYGVIAQAYCPVAVSWIGPLASFMGAAGAFVSLQSASRASPFRATPSSTSLAPHGGKDQHLTGARQRGALCRSCIPPVRRRLLPGRVVPQISSSPGDKGRRCRSRGQGARGRERFGAGPPSRPEEGDGRAGEGA